MITSLSQLDLNNHYTFQDYLSWTLKERIELIKGKIFKMSPAPSARHQEISSNMHGLFWSSIKNNPCQVFSAPFDVQFSEDTILQPDICVICDPKKITDKGCVGAPDLIVEILSPSSTKRDVHYKYSVYEESGVKEYWVVYPKDSAMTLYRLIDGKYSEIGIYDTKGQVVRSEAIAGLDIDIEDIFESYDDRYTLYEPQPQYKRI